MTELSDEGKSKILEQLQERFDNLLIKFKNAGLPPIAVLPPKPALSFPFPDDNAADGPPAALVERDREDIFSPAENALN